MITISTRSTGAENRAKASGDSLARLLGEISPKMRITSVMTSVATAGPRASSSSEMKSTVETVVAALLTMLLPMSSVESTLS